MTTPKLPPVLLFASRRLSVCAKSFINKGLNNRTGRRGNKYYDKYIGLIRVIYASRVRDSLRTILLFTCSIIVCPSCHLRGVRRAADIRGRRTHDQQQGRDPFSKQAPSARDIKRSHEQVRDPRHDLARRTDQTTGRRIQDAVPRESNPQHRWSW